MNDFNLLKQLNDLSVAVVDVPKNKIMFTSFVISGSSFQKCGLIIYLIYFHCLNIKCDLRVFKF